VEDATKAEEQQLPFMDNYDSLLNNDQFADVRFVFEDGEPIFAHRMLLAHRCEYFRDLFGCGFKEQRERVIIEKSERVKVKR
jgi:BTB/POZ domain